MKRSTSEYAFRFPILVYLSYIVLALAFRAFGSCSSGASTDNRLIVYGLVGLISVVPLAVVPPMYLPNRRVIVRILSAVCAVSLGCLAWFLGLVMSDLFCLRFM